ncbi:MAG: GGDEF domain-containing protein [Longicatena sp.]
MDNNIEKKTLLMNRILASLNVDLEEEKLASFDLLELGIQDNDMYAIASAHSYLADYYILTRNHTSCLEHLREAISIGEENQFSDLLLLDYTIAGIYYNAHFDEITALQYYLDAYRIAKNTNNLHKQMIVFNNISILFSQKDDFEDAMDYAKRAFDALVQKGNTIETYSDLAVVLNLIELYIHNDLLLDAKKIYESYKSKFQNITKNKQSSYIICLSQIYIAEADKHYETVRTLVDRFIRSNLQKEDNRCTYFNLFLDIFKVLIRIKDKARAEKFLQFMGELCLNDDIEQQLQLHYSWIQFAETFHMEDALINSYKQYYLLQKMVVDTTNKTKAESMKEKIVVYHMMDEHNKILLEKNILATQVKTDCLTKLFSRSYFNTIAEAMQTNESVEHICFILLDVDYFKEYNDYYGHYQGDMLLKQIANCLDENCDSRFFVARYGGDEFVCLSVNTTENEINEYLNNVYHQLYELQIEHKGSKNSDRATLSAGFAIFKNDDTFKYEVGITLADAALYKAKQDGKNRFVKY